MIEPSPKSEAYLWGYRDGYANRFVPVHNPYDLRDPRRSDYSRGHRAGENDLFCDEILLTRKVS